MFKNFFKLSLAKIQGYLKGIIESYSVNTRLTSFITSRQNFLKLLQIKKLFDGFEY